MDRTEGQESGTFVRVWKFRDAPEELRKLSDNGGDEDWLALIPPDWFDYWEPAWLDVPAFGCCDVLEYDVPGKPGWKVRIGCHA